ncbi:MAG: hypothetical protein F6K14_15805 [Symploca sp. SIO2C1]|nr:hypothetical protein [Symploca sp. SIO2C1]
MQDNDIPVFVNGFSGHIRVEDYRNRLKISEEKETYPRICNEYSTVAISNQLTINEKADTINITAYCLLVLAD